MPTFEESADRVAKRGWIVDRNRSYRSFGTDRIYGYDSEYKDYEVGVGIDSQSGKVKDATIVKDPSGTDRCAKPWPAQSIPAPEQVAAEFERTDGSW